MNCCAERSVTTSMAETVQRHCIRNALQLSPNVNRNLVFLRDIERCLYIDVPLVLWLGKIC